MQKKVILIILIIVACKAPEGNLSPKKLSFQEEMRQLIQNISKNAKAVKPDFFILPRNGIELLKTGILINSDYQSAIDGQLVEGQFYGYSTVNQVNSVNEINYFEAFLGKNIIGTKPVFNIDFCNSETSINNSLLKNQTNGNKTYISLNKELNLLPLPNFKIVDENSKNITSLSEAKNFMILLKYDNYSKENLLDNLTKTNFDLIIINGYFKSQLLSIEEIKALKTKKNGGKRLVITEMDISQADSKKDYWQQNWRLKLPNFVNKEIGIVGDFRVNYWDAEWQNVLSGNENSLINTFLKLGYDGVLLTGSDAYKYYE